MSQNLGWQLLILPTHLLCPCCDLTSLKSVLFAYHTGTDFGTKNSGKMPVSKVIINLFHFLTFPACFSIPIIFSNLNSNCPNRLDLRNLQEQVKKAFCHQKLFWPWTVWINCSSDRKKLWNSRLKAENLQIFEITKTTYSNSWSLEQFLVTECFFNLFLEVSQT